MSNSIDTEAEAPTEAEMLADLLERLENGEAAPVDIVLAKRHAEKLTDRDMLILEPFDGDESDVTVMDKRVVIGRKDYVCHWTGLPIKKGERHLVLREVCEGEFLTTRHSMLAIWMSNEGYDPSGLRQDERMAA